MASVLGLDGKLYYNTASFGTPTWTEITNVKDLDLPMEKSEADVTTRNNGGFRAVRGALKSATLSFGMVYDPTDTIWEAIRDAFMNNTTVEFAVADGAIATVGTEYFRAETEIMKFGRSEQLEQAMMSDVEAKPTYTTNGPPTWNETSS